MTPRRRLRVAVLLLAAPMGAAAQPSLALDTVLDRFRASFTSYAEKYSATVATEHYEQTLTSNRYRQRSDPFHVKLVSDFAVVRAPDSQQWLGFRDVRRVNGVAVGGPEGRLAKLVAHPSESSINLGWEIAKESARYNLGRGFRSLNNPSVAFEVLDPRHHAQFRFSKEGEQRVDGFHVWVIHFAERDGRPRVVQTTPGGNTVTEGRAWVDPLTGRLVRTQITVSVSARSGPSQIDERVTLLFSFAQDPRLSIWVPTKMHERYTVGTRAVLLGEATYSGYRQFAVESRVLP